MRKSKKVGKSIKRVFSKVMVLMLSLLFILQMFLPIVIHATEAMDDNNENEVETVEQSETEVEAEFIEEPVEEESIEQEPLEEEPAEDVVEEPVEEMKPTENAVDEPVNDPEENTNEQPPPATGGELDESVAEDIDEVEAEQEEVVDVEAVTEDEVEAAAEATVLTFEEEGIKIEITAEAGVIPEGTSIQLNPIAATDMDMYLDAVREQRDNQMSYASLFDINLVDPDGNEIQPDGEVNVSFYGLDHIQEDDDVFVYHVEKEPQAARSTRSTSANAADGVAIEAFDSTVETDKISFKTDHFSIYVVSGNGTGQGTQYNPYEIHEGESIELGVESNWRNDRTDGTWNIASGSNVVTMSNTSNSGHNNIRATIDGVAEGTARITYSRSRWDFLNNFSFDFYVRVTPPADPDPIDPDPIEPEPLQPGEVVTSKTAKPVEGMVNTWDITVRVEAHDTMQTSATVLVIDMSNSMSNEGRVQPTKDAATSFINALLPEGNTTNSIAIVEYASSLFDIEELTGSENRQQLLNTIDSLQANHGQEGGTHTQAAVRKAQELLAASDATHKNIVVISDGEPTFSYGINNPNNYLSVQYVTQASYGSGSNTENVYRNRDATTASVPFSAYNTTRVGTGYAMYHRYYQGSGGSSRYYNHGNSAIAEAGFAKDQGYNLYSVSIDLSQDAQGYDVLEQMASPDKFFAGSKENLTPLLEDIASNIAGTINNGIITDPMGEGFEIPTEFVNQIGVSQGSPIYTDGTITWDLQGPLKLIEGRPNVRYAEMTYRVEINDEILTALPSDTNDNLYYTNGETIINYKDVNGNNKSELFISPEVDPVLLRIKKVLLDETGNPISLDQEFNVQITNDKQTYNHTETLTPSSENKVLTTLRDEGVYTVNELLSAEDEDKFIVTYTIDGVEYTEDSTDIPQFEVNHDENGIPREDVEIIVTNQKIPQTIDFNFTKVDENGAPLEGAEFTLVHEDGTNYPNIGSGANFEFKELKEGIYTLTETKAPEGYRLPTSSWTIEVVRNADGLLEVKFEDGSFMVGELEIPNEKSEFPKTGGIGGFGYLSIGSLLIMLSFNLFIKKDKEWSFENE